MSITIHLALAFYVLNFIAYIALVPSHYFSFSDLFLILITLGLSIVFLKSKLFKSFDTISWRKIFLAYFALYAIFGVPIIWYDFHTSSWFQGLASIAYGVIAGISTLILSTASYFLLKSMTAKRFAVLPTILHCIILLYFFIAMVGPWFDVLYLLDSRINPPQVQKNF